MEKRQRDLIMKVDENRQLILDAERYIWKHPETGFREWNTSAYMEGIFKSLGYELVKPDNIPGFYADLDTGHPGPRVLIMGELDALICKTHPEAVNGNVHACGHNAQCAALIGVAAALKSNGALDGLSGSIRLMAVPAEELIEVEFRESLRRQGIIKYFGGKVEFMRRGYMDDVDLALMIHTTSKEKLDFECKRGCNGCVAKSVTVQGVAAHAGGSPHNGGNALYAANIGMQAINAIRETFKEEDHIRVHPIITEGGESVNIIPSKVKIESYVRGASVQCIAEVNSKVNRAFAAGAAALGARLFVSDRPGYSPLNNDANLMEVAKTCMEMLAGPERVSFTQEWSNGCTDMGDISCVMPAIHPYAGGASGIAHGENYSIKDPERACVNSAKAQVLIVDALLTDNAVRAKHVIENARPIYPSFREYFDAVDALFMDRDLVAYDGSKITIGLETY